MKQPLPPLARVLRELRAEQGVDQLDLALAIGASDGSYLSKLENGRAMNPSATFLARYVDAFRILGHALGDDQRERLAAAVLVAERPATTPAAVLSRGLDACAAGSWTHDELAAVQLQQHRDLLCVLAVLAIDLESAAHILEVGDPAPEKRMQPHLCGETEGLARRYRSGHAADPAYGRAAAWAESAPDPGDDHRRAQPHARG